MVKAEWTEGRYNEFNQPLCLHDFESEFKLYLSYYNMLSEAADRGFDNIPYMRVDFCRVAYLIAIAYGCKPIEIKNVINAKPIIFDIDDIYKIEKPQNIWEYGLYPEITRRIMEIEKRLGPVGFVSSDTQSPIDVLTEIVDAEEAMCAMFTDKESIHYLLDLLTQSIEEINRYQSTIVSNWIGYGHDYPITRGIHLSDDNAAFLSPGIYEEFAKPYAERLAKSFGGVTLHCCMRYGQNIEIMANTEGFLGFDPQLTYHREHEVFPYIKDKGYLRVFTPQIGNLYEYYTDIIDKTENICGLMIEVFGNSKDETLRLAQKVKDYADKKGRCI